MLLVVDRQLVRGPTLGACDLVPEAPVQHADADGLRVAGKLESEAFVFAGHESGVAWFGVGVPEWRGTLASFIAEELGKEIAGLACQRLACGALQFRPSKKIKCAALRRHRFYD